MRRESNNGENFTFLDSLLYSTVSSDICRLVQFGHPVSFVASFASFDIATTSSIKASVVPYDAAIEKLTSF